MKRLWAWLRRKRLQEVILHMKLTNVIERDRLGPPSIDNGLTVLIVDHTRATPVERVAMYWTVDGTKLSWACDYWCPVPPLNAEN